MALKELITSKWFIAGTLGVVCIAILVVCLMWGTNEHEFIVEDPVPLAAVGIWTETLDGNSGVAEGAGQATAWQSPVSNTQKQSGGQQSGSPDVPAKEYPQVVKETGDEVVIMFTDPAPCKEPAPETPGTDPANNPTNTRAPQQTGQPGTSPPATRPPGTPSLGSSNGNGEVYDPVFGWIKPGNVEQTEIDSSGDPDKIVGKMN